MQRVFSFMNLLDKSMGKAAAAAPTRAASTSTCHCDLTCAFASVMHVFTFLNSHTRLMICGASSILFLLAASTSTLTSTAAAGPAFASVLIKLYPCNRMHSGFSLYNDNEMRINHTKKIQTGLLSLSVYHDHYLWIPWLKVRNQKACA